MGLARRSRGRQPAPSLLCTAVGASSGTVSFSTFRFWSQKACRRRARGATNSLGQSPGHGGGSHQPLPLGMHFRVLGSGKAPNTSFLFGWNSERGICAPSRAAAPRRRSVGGGADCDGSAPSRCAPRMLKTKGGSFLNQYKTNKTRAFHFIIKRVLFIPRAVL